MAEEFKSMHGVAGLASEERAADLLQVCLGLAVS